MGPCELDRLPVAILQDILHRAACCSDWNDKGYGFLEKKLGSCVEPSMQWPQVAELCRLQVVSKQFLQVSSTEQTLHCRISPLHAKRDLQGSARFLARARCAKALVLTLRPRQKDYDLGLVKDWNNFQELGGKRGLRHCSASSMTCPRVLSTSFPRPLALSTLQQSGMCLCQRTLMT